MKNFFGINESFRLEWDDFSAFMTILNVSLILMGFWFAPFFGLANCVVSLCRLPKAHCHINLYAMNLALIVLNLYFLLG